MKKLTHKKKHHYPSSYIDWSELKNVINSLITENKKTLAMYISLSSYMGLRYSDAIRFSWNDLKEDEFTITEQKTQKDRTFVVHPELREIINKCRPENLYDEKALIFTRKNKLLTSQGLNQSVKRIKKRYNISAKNVSLHSFRKSFSRKYWENHGKTEAALMMLSICLGHSSTSITRRYLGITNDDIKNVYLSL